MPKRYILTLILITILFFGGIFLLIRLISGATNRDSSSNSGSTSQTSGSADNKDAKRTFKLADDGRRVSYTMNGRVVGDEDRRAIRITVDQSERRLEILGGYDGTVISTMTYPNNQDAFKAFLLALAPLGFDSNGRDIQIDYRSACPLGIRYVFDTLYNDNSSVSSWATSCSAREGSFVGQRSVVDQLFRAQIPDYSSRTSGVRLN